MLVPPATPLLAHISALPRCALQLGHRRGLDRLYLRLPMEAVHMVDARSPLASWLAPGGMEADAEFEIVFVVEASEWLHACIGGRQGEARGTNSLACVLAVCRPISWRPTLRRAAFASVSTRCATSSTARSSPW